MNITIGQVLGTWYSREDGTEEQQNSKTWMSIEDRDMTINGKVFDAVEFAISGGQVTSAEVHHDDFTEEQKEKLSKWWYGVNFANLEWEDDGEIYSI